MQATGRGCGVVFEGWVTVSRPEDFLLLITSLREVNSLREGQWERGWAFF